MRIRQLHIVLCAIALALVVVLVPLGIGFHNAFMEIGYNNYMPAGAAKLIIEHMKANHGAWPRSWDDLHKTFLSVSQDGVFAGFRWEAYSSRLGIDFTADPAKLAAAAREGNWRGPSFRLIWLLPDRTYEGPIDPNKILQEYFLKQARSVAEKKEQLRTVGTPCRRN